METNRFSVNELGFITTYMVSGPNISKAPDSIPGSNQLDFEKRLRETIALETEGYPDIEIKAGSLSSIGCPWNYYYSYGNSFVDGSSFYSRLAKADMLAAVDIHAEEDMELPIIFWSYPAIEVWLAGKKIAFIKKPVYNPIGKLQVSVCLKKGVQRLLIKSQNLAVRDTRNLFGVQLERSEGISLSYPDESAVEPFVEAASWLDNVACMGDELVNSRPAPQGFSLVYDREERDITKQENRFYREELSGLSRISLNKEFHKVKIAADLGGQVLERTIELVERIHPKFEEESIYQKIAEIEDTDRGEDESFSIFNLLARKHLNRELPQDNQYFLHTLKQIEDRIDCSDFLMSAVFRYLKNYEISSALSSRVKEVLLGYRYWMDEKGADGMCFWSENHSLLFYTNGMLAGELYPTEQFLRSGRTGSEMYRIYRGRVKEWLIDILEGGFEEFLSGGYLCVTFSALLNVIDYADKELSDYAVQITDRLFKDVAIHTFDGVVMAPQGRVYRDVLYPFGQSVQTLVHLLHSEMPEGYSENLIFLATSSYRVPDKFGHLAKEEIAMTHDSGNAEIVIQKNMNYILTSVQSPKTGGANWLNICREPGVDQGSFHYVKSMNEWFHGTTKFEPGTYGYQQHMWMGALDRETLFFTNHPGSTCEESSMRPGYWYGNGVMPAIRQKENMLGVIYSIPESHPIHFTHVFWCNHRFDETIQSGNWLFGRKGDGFAALWCSRELVLHNDQLFGCEYRAYGSETAYVCVCQSAALSSFEAFMDECRCLQPKYQMEERCLITDTEFSLSFVEHDNPTQKGW